MSRSIEIAESDIVASVELPKSGLGAVAIWVKRDAALQYNLTQSAESCAGRMKVQSQARDTCTCEYYCDGTRCVPCTCNCLQR